MTPQTAATDLLHHTFAFERDPVERARVLVERMEARTQRVLAASVDCIERHRDSRREASVMGSGAGAVDGGDVSPPRATTHRGAGGTAPSAPDPNETPRRGCSPCAVASVTN
jgi:hypothetical protein